MQKSLKIQKVQKPSLHTWTKIRTWANSEIKFFLLTKYIILEKSVLDFHSFQEASGRQQPRAKEFFEKTKNENTILAITSTGRKRFISSEVTETTHRLFMILTVVFAGLMFTFLLIYIALYTSYHNSVDDDKSTWFQPHAKKAHKNRVYLVCSVL